MLFRTEVVRSQMAESMCRPRRWTHFQRKVRCILYPVRRLRHRIVHSCGWKTFLLWMPYLGAALYMAALAMVVIHHEMWRDELQSWLLVRESPTPWALFSYIKYEGHPGLWHLLLWPMAHLWSDPAGIQIMNLLLAGVTAFVVFRFAPFSWILRLLLMGGYFYVFEWGVIARNYLISSLLLFLVCVLYPNRWRNLLWIGGLVFLLCHTNIHSVILSVILLVMLGIDYAVAFAGKFRGADRYFRRCMLGFLLILAGITSGIVQIKPPSDSGYATHWQLSWKYEPFRRATTAIHHAFFPVPREGRGYWNSSRLIASRGKEAASCGILSVSSEAFPQAGFLILLLSLFFFVRRPWCGIQFVLMALGLVLFFYVKYQGSFRHHGMIWLAFLACFWMSYGYDPWRLPWGIPEKIADWLDRHREWLLLPLLCIQIWGTKIAVKMELHYPFSNAKSASVWIRQEYPDRETLFFAGMSGPSASTLCGFLDGVPFYYPEKDGFGGAMIWNQARIQRRAPQLSLVEKRMQERKQDCILVCPREMRETELPPGCRFLQSFHEQSATGECYWLYLWKYQGQ